ncbi:hypothetical protein ACFYZB_34090 [Streptomyces sp. NPDC001852]|uniref:hypothetical protein n=1 Tax=Streptomyces sp. NPDC001852 TaxID=3364619 RepID=UPI0036D0D4DC
MTAISGSGGHAGTRRTTTWPSTVGAALILAVVPALSGCGAFDKGAPTPVATGPVTIPSMFAAVYATLSGTFAAATGISYTIYRSRRKTDKDD